MIWKYIVTWLLITEISIPCDFGPKKADEFGRMPEGITYAVYCFRRDTVNKTREFINRDEALSFMERAKKQGIPANIDSVIVKATLVQ